MERESIVVPECFGHADFSQLDDRDGEDFKFPCEQCIIRHKCKVSTILVKSEIFRIEQGD
jgi:hypothetical protein